MGRWRRAIIITAMAIIAAAGGGTLMARSRAAGLVVVAGPGLGATQLSAAYRVAGRWRAATVRAVPPERPAHDHRLVAGRTAVVRVRARGAEAMLAFPVEGDTISTVVATIGRDDPTRGCMGCERPVSVVLPGGGRGERLWLYRGLNGLSAPRIY